MNQSHQVAYAHAMLTVLIDKIQAETVDTHNFENDPPTSISSMRRLTCKNCGRAILIRPNDTVYGSASETKCDNRLEKIGI